MPSLEQLISNEDISVEQAAKLEKLQPGSHCEHKSWGYGTVISLDQIQGTITIDFEKKQGHKMDVLFALESLTPLPQEHIYCLIKNEPEQLQNLASEQPIELLRIVLDSLGKRATPETIQATLCPSPIPISEWKKWWENTRKLARADGRFTFPTSKNLPVTYIQTAKTQASVIKTASESKGTSQALKALHSILKEPASIPAHRNEALALLHKVEDLLGHMPSLPKAREDVLRLALARDELAEILGVQPRPSVLTAALMATLEQQIPEVINTLSPNHQTRLLKIIQQREPSTWQAAILSLLKIASSRLLTTIREYMASQNLEKLFDEGLARAVRELSLSSEGLIWIIKNRKSTRKDLINSRLFVALIAAIERDQIGDSRSARLHDLVISDKNLLTDLLEGADNTEVRDVTRQLMLCSVFSDMDKRSLLARLIKKFPDIESFVTGTLQKTKETSSQNKSEASQPAESGKLIVSWSSLERRKAELDELINKKIPANTQEIAIARSYGDLRENAEFKFAKEQQAVLARRRAELEADLMRAEGTDFSNPDTSRCGIGTTITLSGPNGLETFTILGAWDADPSRNIISYLTPAARALQGRSVGDMVEMPREDGTTATLRVEKIEPFSEKI